MPKRYDEGFSDLSFSSFIHQSGILAFTAQSHES
jgi:hypothetical protein